MSVFYQVKLFGRVRGDAELYSGYVYRCPKCRVSHCLFVKVSGDAYYCLLKPFAHFRLTDKVLAHVRHDLIHILCVSPFRIHFVDKEEYERITSNSGQVRT